MLCYLWNWLAGSAEGPLPAGECLWAGTWVLAGEHSEKVGRAVYTAVFWHLETAVADAGEVLT